MKGAFAMRKLATLVVLLALATFGLTACGSSDDESGSTAASSSDTTAAEDTTSSDTGGATAGSGGETVGVAADPGGSLAFEKTDLTAKAGSATIELTNDSSTPHNVELEDSSGEDIGSTDTITNDKASFSTDLKPGKYTFYCGVPGHREAGMEGTITVN